MPRSSPAAAPPRVAPRRRPAQSRSQFTVAAILQATLALIAEGGEEALTTNRIAERAGVSIGTLYQYFPTREAIVDTVAGRARADVLEQLDALLGRVGRGELEPLAMLRTFIALYLRTFDGRGPGGPAFARLIWRSDHVGSLVHSAREASERIAQHLQRAAIPGLREPTPAQAYVLTRSLMGTVRAAVLEGSPLLGSPAFEDELVRMCWALLAAPAEAGG